MRLTPLTSVAILAFSAIQAGCYVDSPSYSYGTAGYALHASDLRVRPAQGLGEIREIATSVLSQSGSRVSVTLYAASSPNAPTANIQGNSTHVELRLNPRAINEIPANSWAFIIGHEFAHILLSPRHLNRPSPAEELRVDIAGAEFAIRAGYDVAPQIGWMLLLRDNPRSHHGSYRDRALELANHFGVSQREFMYWRDLYAMQRVGY